MLRWCKDGVPSTWSKIIDDRTWNQNGGKDEFDPTGANGIASERGAGGVRHIDTITLWLQHYVDRLLVTLRQIPGKANPADIGKQILMANEVWANLTIMGMKPVAGQTKSQKAMVEDGSA